MTGFSNPDLEKAFWRMQTALQAIPKGTKRCPAQGVMPCPYCGKPLSYWHAGPRAMRVSCETPGCVSFMA